MFSDIRSTPIPNGTVLHRNSFLCNVPFDKIAAQHLLSMDYPTNVYMAIQGKVAFIDTITLYWRRDGNTVSSAADRERAFRYIDHEVRQGLFLAKEFPGTAYDFSMSEAEEFRAWQMYDWALSHKDYTTLKKCLRLDSFPQKWLSDRPERKYLKNKMFFCMYVYIIRKCNTAIRMLSNKIRQYRCVHYLKH